MKLANFLCGVVLLVTTCWLAAATPFGYDQSLYVQFSAPPLSVYVSDSSGLRDGIDPNVPLNNVGQQQVGGQDHDLSEIPNSGVDQNNFGQNSTGWEVNIASQSGTYKLYYKSTVPLGSATVAIDLQNYSPHTISTYDLPLLAQEGAYRQVQIIVSPLGLTATPIMDPGNFFQDTQTACGLKAIKPASACEALVDLAQEAEKDIKKNDSRDEADHLEIYLLILDRLYFWGKEGQSGNWGSFKDREECKDLCGSDLHEKFSITSQVYSALKLDAETLLGPIKKQGDHDWRDDHR